ncbi:MAG: type II toxin-antitoxin system RelE/ParE family toxin [Armatimonadetes bacterium]|nr:type II toxin-antitoxin system RelE/ParE family toxin [Armatimonadota bacterium]
MRISSRKPASVKPLRFMQAAHDDLMEMPVAVRQDFGYGLYQLQAGETPNNVSPFEGSTGNSILKLIERHDTDTYRCVFTAKFGKAIYVLHVFKKKSPSGIATPQNEIEVVKARYRRAQELYAEEFGDDSPPSEKRRKKP